MSLAQFFHRPIVDVLQNRRTAVLALIYTTVIAVSFYVAYEVRFDFIVPTSYQEERLQLLPLVVGIKLLAVIYARQLGTMMSYFSVPDLLRLIWAMSVSSGLLLLPRVLDFSTLTLPRGVLLTDFMLCLGTLCIGRLGYRLYRERLSGVRRSSEAVRLPQQRIAIIGAGDVGASLAREFINAPARGFLPVMFFDDDPSKHGKLLHGVPVVGAPELIRESKEAVTLSKAVVAMPSASARRVREIVLLFTHAGLKVEMVPSLEELTSGRVRASRTRPVEVQDLLGREPVNLDSEGIRKLIEGRVVMVTGAGGSIGSELCRQIAALHPQRLLMVEQAEGALFVIEQELNELGFGTIAVPLVADILNRRRMAHVFERYAPAIVFHAAAHKHVYLMERQPGEAVRNNVLGTRQLARSAADHGVDAFVFISTDKAINPTSVMGATKRLAEIELMAIQAHLLEPPGRKAAAAPDAERAAPDPRGPAPADAEVAKDSAPWHPAQRRTKFMAVRFGNVLGSSGSVIPIFKRQIDHGGPVTVTHPDVTRYFMTIPEAVGLVLQSSVLGKGGEIFVLDMGEPVKIFDLARQMIELSGYKPGEDIEITFTGLKPGEKLFEELSHHGEAYTPTEHPRIMRFTANARGGESGVSEFARRLYGLEPDEVKALLRDLVPEYTPFQD